VKGKTEHATRVKPFSIQRRRKNEQATFDWADLPDRFAGGNRRVRAHACGDARSADGSATIADNAAAANGPADGCAANGPADSSTGDQTAGTYGNTCAKVQRSADTG
jgi:hypothetical protein